MTLDTHFGQKQIPKISSLSMNRTKICNICRRQFETPLLLQSSKGEHFCKECFKTEYCLGNPRTVKKKRQPTLLRRSDGDAPDPTKCMFKQEDITAYRKEREARYNITRTSKKPVQCPHVDCNRYVSVFDLCVHFKNEHPEIPVDVVLMDKRKSALFEPKDVRYGVKQCILLLNVLLPEDTNNGHSPFMEDKIPVPLTVAVLASRIAAAHLEGSECVVEDEEDTAAKEVLCDSDKVILWLASNILTKFTYTVAVSTTNEDIRMKYFGVLQQIGHNPVNICKDGQCLILNSFQTSGMTENGFLPLKLDVIVHGED